MTTCIPTIRAKGISNDIPYYIMEDSSGCRVVLGDEEIFQGAFEECRNFVFKNIMSGLADEVKEFYKNGGVLK